MFAFLNNKCRKKNLGLQGSPWSFRLLPLDHSTLWCHEDKFRWWLCPSFLVSKVSPLVAGCFVMFIPFPKLNKPTTRSPSAKKRMIFQLKTSRLRPAVEAYLNLYWTNNDRWSEAKVGGDGFQLFSASTKTSWRHLMLEIFKASLFQRSTQIGRDFLDGPFSRQRVTATNPTRCVGREFSATGWKGTKKKHGLSS